MPEITLPNTIQNTDVSDADKLMANLNAIVTEYNDTVGGLTDTIIVAPESSATALQVLRRNAGNTANEFTTMAVNRAFTWYLDGTSIDGVAGAVYIAPQDMTVVKIYGITTSGTCTATLKKGATVIDTIACSDTLATETTITDAAITAGDLITLTLSSSSAPVGLKITMEASQP